VAVTNPPSGPPSGDPADEARAAARAADPVLRRRAQIARLVSIGQRVGYSLFALAVVAFGVGFAAGFTTTVVVYAAFSLLLALWGALLPWSA